MHVLAVLSEQLLREEGNLLCPQIGKRAQQGGLPFSQGEEGGLACMFYEAES